MKEKLKNIINTIILERTEDEDRTTLSELESDLSLRDNLNFSSLELASLTVLIEDEFDIDIFEDGIVTTVGEIMEKLK
jgi:acyl carrier protein